MIALWPVQRHITARLDQLKHEVVHRIEQATGRRITYESISPSIFHFIEIRGLEVYDRGARQEPLLRIRRIEVSYSIWKLLTGKPAAALNTISIENSSLHINTQTDSDIITFFDDLLKGGGTTTGIPNAGSIKLDGKNLTLSITSPKGTFTVDRLFFQIQNAGEAVRVQVRGGLALALRNGPLGLRHAETAIRVSGTVDRKLAWSDLRVRFDRLTSNLVNLSRPTFHVTLRDGIWQLRKIQDNAPVDLLASYNQKTQLLKLSFVADRFRPEDYFTFGQKLDRYSPWLTSVLTGKGAVQYSLRTKALSYDANMRVGISNRLVPFPLRVNTAVKGDERAASFSRLEVSSKYGDIHFAGNVNLKNYLPEGTLKATQIYTPLGPRLSAVFAVSRSSSGVQAQSDLVTIGQTTLHGVGITVSPGAKSIDFSLGASFEKHQAEFKSNGTVFLSHGPYVTLAITTDGMPLDRLYTLIDPQPLTTVVDTLKGLKMTSKLFITTNLKQFSFASPKVTISDGRPTPERHMSFRIAGNDRSLDLQHLVVDWRNYHVAGSIDAAYVQKNRVELTTTAVVENQSYKVHGFYQVNDSLILSGTGGLDFAAVKQAGKYVFSLKTDKLPIPFGTVTTDATLDLEGIYAGPHDWQVVSRDTSFKDLPFFPEKQNSLSVSARVSAQGGDIYSLTYGDSISRLTGNGKLALNPVKRGLAGTGWLQMTGSLPGESYAANFDFSPGDLNATVNFAHSPLARLGKLPVSGQVSGNVTVSGRITNPDLAVTLSLPEGQIYSDPITADISFSVSHNEIRLKNLSARYLASSLRNASGLLDFKTGKFDLGGDYRGDVNGDLVRANVAVGGDVAPIARRSELASILKKNFHAVAHVDSITVKNSPVKSWSLSIRKDARELAFSGGPAGGVSGSVLPSGKFSIDLAAPLPITFRADGHISGSKINASLRNVVLDLHAFDTVAKIPYFDIARGKARGNLEITGPLNDPDFSGNLAATAVYGKTPVVPNEIGPFSTDLVFLGKSLSMSNVDIRSGNTHVLGNLTFSLDHWIPSSYDLRFTTQGTQGLHVKYSISGIDFNGYANGTTTIKGDPNGTTIGGTLEISSCLITLGNGSEVKSNRAAANDNNTNYDFTFTTGKQVQFVWPNNTLPILRSFADTGQKLKITENGSTGDYSIVGTINVKGGEIFYLRQSFYLRQGSIAFNEDQNKFDPIINARAELREVDAQGQNVSIYLVVNNKPLSQFAPSFESNPPMSNSEILALLGQDIYSQLGGQQLNLTSAALFTGDLLSQFSLLRTFEDKVKQAFNLDLFSVRTDLLQNLFREKVLGENLPTTTTTPGSTLGRYLDNTTFFLGKYFGNDLFLEAMINLRSNNAFLSQYGSTGTLQVDSQFLFDWRTPLFLLQLSVQPDPTDLLSSLSKTSLSLSWGFSF